MIALLWTHQWDLSDQKGAVVDLVAQPIANSLKELYVDALILTEKYEKLGI